MADDAYDWDAGNREHIRRRHGLGPDEVVEALDDPFGFVNDEYEVDGEDRYDWLGIARNGEILLVVFTQRYERIRPVSARRATPAERRRYLRLR